MQLKAKLNSIFVIIEKRKLCIPEYQNEYIGDEAICFVEEAQIIKEYYLASGWWEFDLSKASSKLANLRKKYKLCCKKSAKLW